MIKAWNYIKKLIQSDSKESSKRFVFLYFVLIVLTPLIFIHTNSKNFLSVLAEIFLFLGLLAGFSSYPKNKSNGES